MFRYPRTYSLQFADDLLKRSQQVCEMPSPKTRDIRSLQNWVSGNGCISRSETDFLNHSSDLASITTYGDKTVASVEPIVEGILIAAYKFFNIVRDTPPKELLLPS